MELYFLFHGPYLLMSNFLWIVTFVSLSDFVKTTKKRIVIISGIFYGCLEIIYIMIIFIDTTILGTPLNEIQVNYAILSELILLYCLAIMTILGYWLAIRTMKLDDKKVQLKGRLLFCSFILFVIAAILEIITPTIPMIVMARILVVLCAILFYGGFILPNWMERIFLRKKQT